MSTFLAHFARLRRQLAVMETDIGLDRFTPEEVNLICAVVDLSGPAGTAQAVELRGHPLCRRLSKPTFYRALGRLMDLGVLARIGSERSGLYRLDPRRFPADP